MYNNSQNFTRRILVQIGPQFFLSSVPTCYRVEDFSVNSVNVKGFADGRVIAVAGTSAGPPAIGAKITVTNDARLAAGKSSVVLSTPRYIQPTSRRPSTILGVGQIGSRLLKVGS